MRWKAKKKLSGHYVRPQLRFHRTLAKFGRPLSDYRLLFAALIIHALLLHSQVKIVCLLETDTDGCPTFWSIISSSWKWILFDRNCMNHANSIHWLSKTHEQQLPHAHFYTRATFIITVHWGLWIVGGGGGGGVGHIEQALLVLKEYWAKKYRAKRCIVQRHGDKKISCRAGRIKIKIHASSHQ